MFKSICKTQLKDCKTKKSIWNFYNLKLTNIILKSTKIPYKLLKYKKVENLFKKY